MGLAVIVFGFGALAAGIADGGNLPMIALGLILAAMSMDILRAANSRNPE